MINSQTRDRRGGHKTTPLSYQRGSVGFTPDERDFIKREARRSARREAKHTLADAKQQYWDELDMLYMGSLGSPDDYIEDDLELIFFEEIL